jgi:hypothetical protein
VLTQTQKGTGADRKQPLDILLLAFADISITLRNVHFRGKSGYYVESLSFAMTKHVALVRAVNVGGTGKLPMADLKAMCRDSGFMRVQTYIASGNVVFESGASPVRGVPASGGVR